MSKISVFQDIARKLGESNPYRKASKYGMAPDNMSGQAKQVASNRADRIRQHNRMINDMKSDLEDQMDLEGWSDNMDSQYDDYIEGQIQALRESLEDQRPSSWSRDAMDVGLDEGPFLEADFEPEDFYGDAPSDYIDNNILEKWSNLGDRYLFGGAGMPTMKARRRTPIFNDWKKSLAISQRNKKLGHNLAKLNAMSQNGMVVPKNGAPVVGGEGKGFSLDAIVEGLRKQGYSDKDIMQYIMNTKVQK